MFSWMLASVLYLVSPVDIEFLVLIQSDLQGGFTVLSTKGISTLITLEWIEIFTDWITYPTVLVRP